MAERLRCDWDCDALDRLVDFGLGDAVRLAREALSDTGEQGA